MYDMYTGVSDPKRVDLLYIIELQKMTMMIQYLGQYNADSYKVKIYIMYKRCRIKI